MKSLAFEPSSHPPTLWMPDIVVPVVVISGLFRLVRRLANVCGHQSCVFVVAWYSGDVAVAGVSGGGLVARLGGAICSRFWPRTLVWVSGSGRISALFLMASMP